MSKKKTKKYIFLTFLFGISLSGFVLAKNSTEKALTKIQNVSSPTVLAAITSLNDLVFKVDIPTILSNTLEVQGTSTLADVGVDSISLAGDLVTSSATEINYLDGLTLTQGAVAYSTDANVTIGTAGSTDQILTSAGTDAPTWKSLSDLSAGKLDDLDSTAFLRSDTSDSYTSGTLSFSDGTLLDLSAIALDDTTAQGLKLPQGASLSSPSTGEGYLAYDTTQHIIQFFNGTSWGGPGISGEGVDGQVAFWTGTGALSKDSSFLWDSTTDILSIGSGGAVNPTVNLGADLGSPSLRWNNLYVGTIYSNESVTFEGQGLFTYDPADTTYPESSVLINPTAPAANEWMLGVGQGGYQRAGIDAEGDLTLGYNSAVSAPSNSGPLSIYNHSSSQVLGVDTSGNVSIEGAIADITDSALTVNDDLVVSGGEVLFTPIASATTSSEGNLYYDSDVDHLMLYTGSASWHRVALDMTQFTGSNASLATGSYLEVAHNQATNDVQAIGWVYDGTKYVEITDAAGVHNIYDTALQGWWKMEEASGTLDNAEGTAANDIIDQGTPTYQATGKLNYGITFDGSSDFFCSSADSSTCGDVNAFDPDAGSFSIGGWFKHNTIASASDSAITKFSDSAAVDIGTGADGAITVSSSTDINTTSLISGRSCADGGDAVNYQVTAMTSNTATLSSTPSAGCLAVGDDLLIINLQGTSTAYTNVGKFEILEIQSISTNTITFTANKTNCYGTDDSTNCNSGFGTGDAQNVMAQRVPNYTNVTVNGSQNFSGSAFDGSKGGVIAFKATGTVSVAGRIGADSDGYSGGTAVRDGGASFCNDDGGGDGGSGGWPGTGFDGLCGGGGGGVGAEAGWGGAGGAGSATGGAGA